MTKCFYLVSYNKNKDEKSMEARKQEVKAFQYLNDSIDVELVFLEDIIRLC